MGLAFLTEWLGRGVESPKNPDDVLVLHSKLAAAPGSQGIGIRRFFRAETSITASIIRRANGSATGMGDRAKARRALSDHNADCAAALTLQTNAMAWRVGFAAEQVGADDFKELRFVDRATS